MSSSGTNVSCKMPGVALAFRTAAASGSGAPRNRLKSISYSYLKITNNKVKDAKLYGAVFSVKQTTESNRLYKVESLTYNNEGLIEVSGSHAPLLSDGTLATINYNSDDFTGL